MIRWPDQLVDLLVPIEEVRQHPDNPNCGDAEAIAESIQVNGYTAPVVVQRSTGYVIDGNHRYEALLSLNSHSIPVVYVDVDNETAYRILINSNRLTRLGRDDPAQLMPLLAHLQRTERGLLATGYTEDDLLRMVKADDPPPTLALPDEKPKGDAYAVAPCPTCGRTFD